MMDSETCDALILGGGPAGLRAAEIISATGLSTMLADRKPSVGRKFLVAGRGGLNLTHSEALAHFPQRYGTQAERWHSLLADFSPDDLRNWAHGMEVDTFVGTSGRVFPMSKQAAPLLRRWVVRLRDQGVVSRLNHQLIGLCPQEDGISKIILSGPNGEHQVQARSVVLALGGASWPQTGSDGSWVEVLSKNGIKINPLVPANVGYEVDWPADLLSAAEGLPLKNILVRAGNEEVAGELLITHDGLEGGAIYQLGRTLRGMDQLELHIDLKPTFSVQDLAAKLERTSSGLTLIERAGTAWRLSKAAQALLRMSFRGGTAGDLAALTKTLPLKLHGPRPIGEAISSAGGVCWSELDEDLMLRRLPGVFCAGEMIDWEAPTGGYLLQGCFSTGTRAARGVISSLERRIKK